MQPVVTELIPPPHPVAACERLAGLPYRLLFDSAAPDRRLGQYSFLTADPVAVIRSKGPRCELQSPGEAGFRAMNDFDPLGLMAFMRDQHRLSPLEGLPPFQGGLAGYLAYDLGRTLEPIPSARFDDLALPDVCFGVYDWVMAWDHASGRAWVISTGVPHQGPAQPYHAEARRDQVLSWLLQGVEGARPAPEPLVSPPPEPAPSYPVDEPGITAVPGLRSSFTRDGYIDAVARVRQYIAAGDIFQANLSQRFEVPFTESPWAFYRRLRTRNAAPFAAFLDFPGAAILSASPERFLRVAPDGTVETRPIKGTRPRGIGPEHDAHLGRELTESAKDQAENLMIVDLMRNDLSRVCRPGTVHVAELFALEHYATVHHLVSTVVGRLAPGEDGLSLLRAAFPGGSVTGAPKIRAMEIIAELEPSERGVYCGAIGYVGFTGAVDTNIAIRTAVARAGRLTFSAGGGITYNSDPAQEYRETLDKARGMIDTLTAADGTGPRQP